MKKIRLILEGAKMESWVFVVGKKFLLSLLIPMTLILQGCVAALPVALLATSGFQTYKAIQTSTGGSVEVRFQDSAAKGDEQRPVVSIKRLAVWPGGSVNVKLAELLQKNGSYEVTTPNTVKTALEKTNNQSITFDQLTENEKTQLFMQTGKTLGVDGILVYEERGGSSDIKYWSFGRAEATTDFTLRIVSPEIGKVIWVQDGQIVSKVGSKVPPSGEVEQIVASACVEKILIALGK